MTVGSVTARLLLVVAAVLVCGLVTAGAFWALGAMLGEEMPHPLWGFVGGVGVGPPVVLPHRLVRPAGRPSDGLTARSTLTPCRLSGPSSSRLLPTHPPCSSPSAAPTGPA